MKKILILLVIFAFSNVTLAIDPAHCPESFHFSTKIESVYKSSMYSKVPGWKEARETLVEELDSQKTLELKYSLDKKKTNICIYQNLESGNIATLLTQKGNDPELSENEQTDSDLLVVNFKVGSSLFSVIMSVETYNQQSMKVYGSEKGLYRSQIRAQLKATNSKWYNDYPIGMTGSEIK